MLLSSLLRGFSAFCHLIGPLIVAAFSALRLRSLRISSDANNKLLHHLENVRLIWFGLPFFWPAGFGRVAIRIPKSPLHRLHSDEIGSDLPVSGATNTNGDGLLLAVICAETITAIRSLTTSTGGYRGY